MTVAGQSETSKSEWSMSACRSPADLDQGKGLVSFVPEAVSEAENNAD
jgi:hypothetical protein